MNLWETCACSCCACRPKEISRMGSMLEGFKVQVPMPVPKRAKRCESSHFWESPSGGGIPNSTWKVCTTELFFLLFFCCVFFFSNKWKDIFFPLIFSGMIVGEANTFFSWGKSDNKGNKNIWGERRFHGKKLDKGNTVLGEASVEGKQCQHSWNSDVF